MSEETENEREKVKGKKERMKGNKDNERERGKGRKEEGGVEDLCFHNLAFMTKCFWSTQCFGTLISQFH